MPVFLYWLVYVIIDRFCFSLNYALSFMKKSVAVVFVAHGEAETAGLVENYRVARHTMAHAGQVMHIPKPLQVIISVLGSLINVKKALTTRFLSPHNENTRLQAKIIQEKLNDFQQETGLDFKFYTTFLSNKPFFEEEIKDIVEKNDYAVYVSLSTIDTELSSGIICQEIETNQDKMNVLNAKLISQHWKEEAFTNTIVDHIFGDRKFKSNPNPQNALILAFHGTIVKDKDGNTPSFHTGLDETLHYADVLKHYIEKDPRNFYGKVFPAYLNHEVGGTWTEPSLENLIDELKDNDINHVALFPCGFLVDGAETLANAKLTLSNSGIDSTVYIPALNQDDAFMNYLTERIKIAIKNFFEPHLRNQTQYL